MSQSRHFLAFTVSVLLATDPLNAQSRPPLPQRLVNHCAGEWCSFGCLAVARAPIALLSRDEHGAPVTAHLKAGDTVTVETGNTLVTTPGIVVILRDTVIPLQSESPSRSRVPQEHFARGDTVFLLAYIELGAWHWWYRGRRSTGNGFWSGNLRIDIAPRGEGLAAVIRSEPVVELWRYLVTSDGRRGWSIKSDQRIDYLEDYCG